jgi:hypothetical protein
MLGFGFADSGDEAPPFAPKLRTLGLLLSVDNLQKGAFTVEHTESITTGVSQMLMAMLETDTCGTEELERLHGRLIWYDSFCFGRLPNSLGELNQSAGLQHIVDLPFHQTPRAPLTGKLRLHLLLLGFGR